MAIYLMTLIDLLVILVTVILFLNALLSFAPLEPWHPARRFLDRLAEPIVRPFRNIVPPVGGRLDLSPLIAWFVIRILAELLKYIIRAAFFAG